MSKCWCPVPTLLDWRNTPWTCPKGCGRTIPQIQGPPSGPDRKAGGSPKGGAR